MKLLLTGLLLLVGAPEPTYIRAVITPAADRKPAPAFRLEDATGTRLALSRLRGSVVVLDFWATDCGGCKVEIPWFMQFAQVYKSAGLEVLGVSEDIPYEELKSSMEAWAKVRPFMERQKINYTIVMADDAVTKTYTITSLPVTYLLDRKGRIAAKYNGLVDRHDIEHNIETLLRER